MRRPLAALALAAAGLLAVPAVAQVPGDPVRVEPSTAGTSSHMIVDIHGSADPKANGRPATHAVIDLAQGFRRDLRARSERCTESRAKAFDCPGKSKIGSGTADATVSNGAISQAVVADVSLFLAPRAQSSDAAGVWLIFTERSSGSRAWIFGRLLKLGSHGPFGIEARFENFETANSAAPEGFTVRLDRIQVEVGASRTEKITVCCKTVRRNGKKKKVRYRKKVVRNLLHNPKSCDGSWDYQVRIRYSATDESVRDGVMPCTNP
ncbi:MAG TPA: hypothetical protein VF517_11065 [Thermoleophilaceae bacterium]